MPVKLIFVDVEEYICDGLCIEEFTYYYERSIKGKRLEHEVQHGYTNAQNVDFSFCVQFD